MSRMRQLARMAVVVALCACQSAPAPPAGEACAHAVDCPPGSVCMCPGGERSCPEAVCTERCVATPQGFMCPAGGACVLKSSACCEGIASCTLNCIRENVCDD